jgi:hypothetical protein
MQCTSFDLQFIDELRIDQPELIGTNTAIEAGRADGASGLSPLSAA